MPPFPPCKVFNYKFSLFLSLGFLFFSPWVFSS
uniref:Uncharacterized protein n=1 Tax=Rhizophora mucronata TaxID=61149 RepID=A0A2P2PK28_RHIMU